MQKKKKKICDLTLTISERLYSNSTT